MPFNRTGQRISRMPRHRLLLRLAAGLPNTTRPSRRAPQALLLRSVPFTTTTPNHHQGATKAKGKKRERAPAAESPDTEQEQALDEEAEAVEELLRKDARRRRERADSISPAMLEGECVLCVCGETY